MMYFSQRPYAPKSSEEMNQWKKVINFKERFPQEGLWWTYKETTEFQKLVRSHLTQFIRNRGFAKRIEVNGVWPPPPQRPGLCVGRKEVLKELTRRLGIGEQNDASGQIQPITAVFGMGGVGKTTVAAALAYDPEIRKAFPDGILWTGLGKQPTMISVLAAWGRRFKSEGEKLAKASRLTAAREDLAELLKDRPHAPDRGRRLGSRTCGRLQTGAKPRLCPGSYNTRAPPSHDINGKAGMGVQPAIPSAKANLGEFQRAVPYFCRVLRRPRCL